MKINIIKLIAALVICQLAGGIGALFTARPVATWYQTLKKPSFNPPDWVFGPVWTTLFLLMGIALYLVWNKGWDGHGVKVALLLFFAQLFLNVIWSILFFGMKSPLLGLADIGLLWWLILATMIFFYRVDRAAAWLLAPYILWVSFAAVLNFFIYSFNRSG